MVSLLVHALLGVVAFVVIVKSNPAIFARFPTGSQVSALEVFYYVVGLASLALGWYFNIRFVQEYATASRTRSGAWQLAAVHRTRVRQPRASSASAGLHHLQLLILLPLCTIVDGRRRGIKHAWLFFAFSLFTSFAFGWAFYLATVERQRRHQQVAVTANSPA